MASKNIQRPEHFLLETPDAELWATAFKQALPHSNINEGTMIGWFANAMMCMHDWKERRMVREQGEGQAGSHITRTNHVVPRELEGLSDEMKTRMCQSVVSAPNGFSFKQIEWLDENLSQPYVRTSHRCYFLDSDDIFFSLRLGDNSVSLSSFMNAFIDFHYVSPAEYKCRRTSLQKPACHG